MNAVLFYNTFGSLMDRETGILELIVVNSRRDGKLIMNVVCKFLKETAVTNVNEPCYRSNFRRPILNCNR